jgi:rhodanese-related sulfurtransferase
MDTAHMTATHAPSVVPSFALDPFFGISPAELASRLGQARAPLVLDVRRRPRFDASPRMLPTARYCAPDDVIDFARSQPPGEVVVYCVYGHEVSQNAAATLRTAGWQARFLLGGFESGEPGVDTPEHIAQWQADAVPTVAKHAGFGVTGKSGLTGHNTSPGSHWITRARPKIDRIAVPWLITRFIDRDAAFHYVPTAAVFSEAKRLNAVAYDIPGAPVSHVGDLCSFDAVLHAFDLHLPALDLLATVVRGADTDRLDLAAQAAGLLAVSLGMSRLHATDDHAMLAAMLPVYDALYAWCQDRVAAVDKAHNWKP